MNILTVEIHANKNIMTLLATLHVGKGDSRVAVKFCARNVFFCMVLVDTDSKSNVAACLIDSRYNSIEDDFGQIAICPYESQSSANLSIFLDK